MTHPILKCFTEPFFPQYWTMKNCSKLYNLVKWFSSSGKLILMSLWYKNSNTKPLDLRTPL